MYKSLITITATLAIVSLGSLVSGRAEAGSSVSAPSKYSHASQTTSAKQALTDRQVVRAGFGITGFSSSSAKTSVPKR
jgi:hypothetical protein